MGSYAPCIVAIYRKDSD